MLIREREAITPQQTTNNNNTMKVETFETIEAMNQKQVRQYLRGCFLDNKIKFDNYTKETEERTGINKETAFRKFVNGELGFTVNDLKGVAKALRFPLAGMVLPAVGGSTPKADTKPAHAPSPAETKPAPTTREDILKTLLEGVSRSEVEDICNQIVQDRIPAGLPEKKIILKDGKKIKEITGATHRVFEKAAKILGSGEDLYFYGPAGTGKTELGRQLADAIGLDFYFTSKISAEHHFLGYQDVNGEYKETAFFKAFTKGGLFLFDELDASNPNVLTRLNAALSNRVFDFPHGNFKAHDDFVCLGAGNTDLRGATREYNGRQQQDASLVDRFSYEAVDYDEKLELELASQYEVGPTAAKRVQSIRAAVKKLKIRFTVSMRATLKLSKFITLGFTWAEAEDSTVWKGLDRETIRKIEAEVKASK